MQAKCMQFNLQKSKDLAELILSVVSVIAIFAGGIWGYYQFSVTDTTTSNIQLSVSTETFKYSNEYQLLVIHVKPKNIGKVLVKPGKDGLLVTVREIPGNQQLGAINLEKFPIFHKADLLKKFTEGYELEPGVEYDETETLVVPKGKLYSIKTEIDLGDNTEIDQVTITRID